MNRCAFTSAVGVLGMSGRGIYEPYGALGIVDHIAHPSATGDLVLPLLQIAPVVPMGGQVSTQPVLTVMVRTRARVCPQDF